MTSPAPTPASRPQVGNFAGVQGLAGGVGVQANSGSGNSPARSSSRTGGQGCAFGQGPQCFPDTRGNAAGAGREGSTGAGGEADRRVERGQGVLERAGARRCGAGEVGDEFRVRARGVRTVRLLVQGMLVGLQTHAGGRDQFAGVAAAEQGRVHLAQLGGLARHRVRVGGDRRVGLRGPGRHPENPGALVQHAGLGQHQRRLPAPRIRTEPETHHHRAHHTPPSPDPPQPSHHASQTTPARGQDGDVPLGREPRVLKRGLSDRGGSCRATFFAAVVDHQPAAGTAAVQSRTSRRWTSSPLGKVPSSLAMAP